MPAILLVILTLLPLAACSRSTLAQSDAPPPIAREFRGAWVATVNHIDFPSQPGIPVAQMRSELDAIVARAVELKLNALVFQVRPAADAFYKSSLEPWSEYLTGTQGQAPAEGFDPLAYVVERCHQHGLQLHAWFNPFRSWHDSGKSAPHASHVSQKAPKLVVQYGKNQWMDPGEPLAVKWSLATVQEVVQRYDVDGVHLDDYFYPYPETKLPFPDDDSFGRYRAGGGKLSRSDWRRQNIDAYVERLHQIVHEAKPWVQVGISPFGIARPGVPAGIKAGIDQYEQLAADVVKWLRLGQVDYLTPQLYWPIDQQAQAFDVLLQWWHTQNPQHRAIWPGLNAGNALAGKKGWRPDELADQIALIRRADREGGHIHFSFRALRSNAANVGGALRDRIYRDVAIAPAMPWLPAKTPKAPAGAVERGRDVVRWTADPDARFVVVQARERGTWRTLAATDRLQMALPQGAQAVALTAVSRSGAASPATVLPIVN